MYVIYFKGIFKHGYVRHSFSIWKRQTIKFESEEEVRDFATKFRFKFIADLFCWIYNKTSEANLELRKYEVRKIIPEKYIKQ